MVLNIKHTLKNKYLWLILLLFIIGIFLRLYRFGENVMFLGDQGRDATIIKRIVTFEHFPAIGPTTSIGGVFTGPFFYFLVAPFLPLFHFNPAGLAFASFFLSIIGLVIAFFILKKKEGLTVAVIFCVLVIFSSVQIDFSRFSWNPNLLPVFSFITLYYLYKLTQKTSVIDAILLGMFLSFSIQLHYLAGFLFLPLIFIFFEFLFRSRNKMAYIIKYVFAGLRFIIFSSPLIIFDLKHHFLNSENFIKVFTNPAVVAHSSSLSKFLETVSVFLSFVFKTTFPALLALILFLALLVFFIKQQVFKKNVFLQIHFLNFFAFLIFFSFLNSFRLVHYYGPIYYSFYLIVAYLLYSLSKKLPLPALIITVLLLGYVYLNSLHYTFLYNEGNNQIKKSQTVAESIVGDNPPFPYQVVGLPFTQNVDNVRYYLELYGHTPLPEDSIQQPQVLYALCHQTSCEILNNGQWQIAAFTNKKIAKTWHVDEFVIYKLVHGQ